MKGKRVAALFFVLILMFAGLSLRLAQLSSPASGLSQAAAMNGSYNLTVCINRGTIYDCNMKPLVNIKTAFYAIVTPSQNEPVQLAVLSPYVSDLDILKQKLSSRLPFVIEVSSSNISGPGIVVVAGQDRYAVNIAPHIIGYLDSSGNGVSGIEKAFNSVLKTYSQALTAAVPMDASGNELKGLSPQINASGDDTGGVVLTLDKDIQQYAQTAADKYLKDSGAVVVMDPKSGDILACVSAPGFSQDNIAQSLKNTDDPLFNRAFASFNLGSVFKIVVAASALENGFDPDFTYTSKGYIYVPGRSIPFRDADAADLGTMDMSQAFANSCNTYFINLGQKLGGTDILNMATNLGLGSATSFAPGFSSDSGNLPTSSDLQMPAELANFSIGQGELLVTPIQVACIVSSVVNGGLDPTPRLVREVINNNKKVVTAYPSVVADRVYSENTAELLKQFMINTVNEGTGTSAQPEYGGAGGKTGTAQTGILLNGKTIYQAWFAGFYPAESPKYVIVTLEENGTSGAASAGPIFKYIANCLSQDCGYPAVNQ